MAMPESKDNELSTNKEVKRNDDFEKRIKIKEDTIEVAKKLLTSTTEDELSKLGYKEVTKEAGYYGDGKQSYGKGVEQNQYSIKIEGKTSGSLVKKITLGTKRVQSDINIQCTQNGNMVNVEYKTTEAGFSRGVDTKGGTYSFVKSISMDGSKKSELEKGMKALFAEAAKKEVGFLTSTKLGVDDKTEKSVAGSIVNENLQINMKKLTLRSIFSPDEEIFGDTPLNESKSITKKDSNTIPVDKEKSSSKKSDKNKFLFLDKKSEEKEEELTEDAVAGVTASGPTGAGAGAYLTPNAFKATPYGKYKNKKKPQITQEYKVVPMTESDNFWTKVDTAALQGTHPMGMPGIKPNSKEEWDATINGDKNKLKRLGLKESENKQPAAKKHDLTQKKIFSEAENVALGINKRYLITEKTSDEYLKERWKKLTSFNINESINECGFTDEEEMVTECGFDEVDNTAITKDTPIENKSIKQENLTEETVKVQKPGSIWNIEYVFYKKDFMNETKKYILDLESRVFVPNPNAK